MTNATSTQPVVVGIDGFACTGGSLPEFLAGYSDDVRLAVLSAADAGQVQQIVGPHVRPLIPHARCSVMIVHP